MSPSQAIGLVTRAGEGTKIVLAGDAAQIDNPRLDSRTNGLSYASEAMKGSGLCAQVVFDDTECTRSRLAGEAAARMLPKGQRVLSPGGGGQG
jgi:PhoH-like ATPase